MTVLVAGAGIGGLTLALSLHQAGIPVRVYEQTAELQPLGVGINVLPHAVRELDELGLRADLVAAGIETAELAYYTKRGQRIWSERRGLAAGYRWPQVSVHRGRLQMLLFAAARARLGPEATVTGRRVAGYRTTGAGVTVELADRHGAPAGTADGRLLVACDGIHSSIRRHFFPDEGPPIWNGAILWRGVTVAAPFLTGRSMIMAGHEFQKFVCYPIAEEPPAHDGTPRQLINWIAEKKLSPDHDWPREDWNRPGDPADFLPDFEEWRFDWLDVPGLIRAAQAIFEFPMVDRDPLLHWGAGPVTLLGDAAHPMYPIGSNGASQAILDARVLTARLIEHGLSPKALRAYEAERNPATAKVVAANRANGPEQVMQLVETRAPDGFDDIDAVITAEEREDHARSYKRIAGFDVDALNARAPIVRPASPVS